MTLEAKTRMRRQIGMTLFILGCVAPFFSPVGFMLGLPQEWAIGLAAALLIGIPEVLWILAAACMGKDAVDAIKNKLWKKKSPPADQ